MLELLHQAFSQLLAQHERVSHVVMVRPSDFTSQLRQVCLQEIQERVFRAMGMSDDEARAKFGWFLDALRLGAPPHGGFALGIERFVALLAGESNIREVIAFPKTASGSDPLTGAPAPTTQERLDELGISVKTPKA